MPSTHLSLYYHLIFSTKHRNRHIDPSWEARLHAYQGGLIRGLGAVALAVGGVEDHVHLLVSLRATHTLSDVLRELKSDSSGWVRSEIGLREFGWQDGYGAFTVSADDCDAVRAYIGRQREHHRTESFQEEYVRLLREHGVEFGERYLW